MHTCEHFKRCIWKKPYLFLLCCLKQKSHAPWFAASKDVYNLFCWKFMFAINVHQCQARKTFCWHAVSQIRFDSLHRAEWSLRRWCWHGHGKFQLDALPNVWVQLYMSQLESSFQVVIICRRRTFNDGPTGNPSLNFTWEAIVVREITSTSVKYCLDRSIVNGFNIWRHQWLHYEPIARAQKSRCNFCYHMVNEGVKHIYPPKIRRRYWRSIWAIPLRSSPRHTWWHIHTCSQRHSFLIQCFPKFIAGTLSL